MLVDLFAALIGDVHQDVADPAITANDGEPGDGLHLTVAGRAAVARAFLAAIQANFEITPSGQRAISSPLIRARRPGAIRR